MSGGVGGSDKDNKRSYSELERDLEDARTENKRLKEAKDMLEEELKEQKDLIEQETKTLRAQLRTTLFQKEVSDGLLDAERERHGQLMAQYFAALAKACKNPTPADPPTRYHWEDDIEGMEQAIQNSLQDQDAELANRLHREMNGNSDPDEGSSSGWGGGF